MTWVDKKEIEPNNNDSQHFPSEGLYIGALSNGASTFPALLFLKEVDGLCMLYNNAEGKNNVNNAWSNWFGGLPQLCRRENVSLRFTTGEIQEICSIR